MKKMIKCYILATTVLIISTALVGGEAAPPDIELVAFGDLVDLAREGNVDKSPDVTRTREDKSFAVLELPNLGDNQQGEVNLVFPPQANIFEHFTPKYDSHPSVEHHGNERDQKFARLGKIRMSKQRSSYNLNRGIHSLSTGSQDIKTIPQNIFTNPQPQPQLSFDQQTEYWASRSKSSSSSTDSNNREFKIVDGRTFATKKRGQEDAPSFNYYDVFEQINDVLTQIDDVLAENKDLDDYEYQVTSNPIINEATEVVTTEVTTSTKGVQKSQRKKIQQSKNSNKARRPIQRKTVKIPIFLPGSLPDLSFVNSLYNPNRARNPAQKRRKTKPSINEVAEAKEQCVDKIEDVEEIVYEEVEECNHSYDEKCHTSYVTEYETHQEEECNDTFNKKCEITYEDKARNETIEVCMNPLVKNCNLSGPEVCNTEYITECFTLNNAKIVVDDIPSCKTILEEKCETKQSGYTAEEECKSWPKQVCSLVQQIKKKFNPVTKCEKVPQEICGPSGCGFVPGPEECYGKVMTIVTNVPLETCYLDPVRNCKQVSKLVPLLTPVEECVDVPKEICQKVKGNPQKVVKQVTKKWCYTPTQQSGLV